MIASANTLNGKKINVGVLKGDLAWLASIHEYGCNIPVTDEMRAFLHSKGLHLKKSTQYIKIPERSFLRSGHDEHIDEVLKKSDRLLSLVVGGQMSEKEFLNEIGQSLASKIKEYAVELRTPENHPFTIEQKGSSNPLVGKESSMIEGISYEVE